MYQIKLDIFEGPFDLLLFLVKKNEVDIYNIPIVKITNEYLEYLELMKELNLNIASEFIVVSATLCYIKSKSLLPKSLLEEKEEDSAQKLVFQLEEYQKYQQISQTFKLMELEQKNIFIPQPNENNKNKSKIMFDDINLFDLLLIFKKLMKNMEKKSREIVEEEFTIEQKINTIIKILEEKKVLDFVVFFETCFSKIELIITFLALLELIKIKKVCIRQTELFGNIKMFLQ
ncbi:MAG: segregation/condensation protein A [bacterium]